MSTATNKLTDKQEAARQAADDLSAALGRLFGEELSIEEATLNHLDAVEALTEGVVQAKEDGDQFATSLDLMTDTGRRNREMVLSEVAAIEQYAQSMLEGGASNDQVAGKVAEMIGQLRSQMIMLGFTEAEVDAYIATLGLTPENIATTFNANTRDAAISVETLRQQIYAIPTHRTVTIDVVVNKNELLGLGGKGHTGAVLADTRQGRIIGTQGHEEFWSPDNFTERSGRIFSHEDTLKMAGGHGGSTIVFSPTINVTAPDGRTPTDFGREIARALEVYMRRNGPGHLRKQLGLGPV